MTQHTTQDSQSELETIVADIIADARSIDIGFAADEPSKYQAALDDGIKAIDQYVHQHAQQTFIKWCEQGRTEEQIWAVQNFLTGAFKEVK